MGDLEGDFPVIVSLDLEATGLSSAIDHVIEIGAVKFRGVEVIERFHTLVNPGLRLPPMIRRLTGISDAELTAAPRLREVVPGLRAFMGDADLLAHGAGYDIAFLDEVLGRFGARQVYDTIDVARVVFPAAPSYSLGALCDLVGLTHPRPHHALEDAEATYRLFMELVRLAGDLPREVLDELRELTQNSSHSLRTFFHDIVRPAPAEPGPVSRPGPVEAVLSDLMVGMPARLPVALPALDADALAALLGPQGPLAAEPGWELRESQQELCRAVAQAFERGRYLVAEVGTGTGKSLAYLLPALAWAASRGDRVCVSTYTINLQEQLLHKDLPLAARILGIPLRAVLLKGRAHYLSRVRWEQLLLGTRGGDEAPGLEGIDAAELTVFKLKLAVWLSRTITGDRDELRMFGQEERIWRAVASEWGDCGPGDCLLGEEPCFYHLSRRRAADADVMVVNHALLLSDVLGEQSRLPAAGRLILDEAHHLEEAATKGLTVEAREDDVLGVLALAAAGSRSRAPGPALVAVEAGVRSAFDALRDACRQVFGSDAGRELRFDDRLRAMAQFRSVEEACAAISAGLARMAEAEAAVARRRLEELTRVLCGDDPDHVTWVSFGRDGRAAVRRAPIDVADTLRAALFDERDSVVMTSATLSVSGSFDYFCSRVGVPASRRDELVLGSPFDFLQQALLCLPEGMPEPNDPGFQPRLVEVVEALARTLGGRTLVLFTSNDQLTAVADELTWRLAPVGIDVMAQTRGGGSRRAMVERFRSSPEAVLCGTNSFWEGVDLPGSGLSCVVIVRLPFRPPGDPVQRARGERLADPFLQLALPEAVLRLKQGFGRLIRRAGDRGAVVILDNRVSTRAYGQHFLDSLPECASFTGSYTDLPAAVAEWIGDRNISFSNEPDRAGRVAGAEAGAGAVRPRPRRRRRQPRTTPPAG